MHFFVVFFGSRSVACINIMFFDRKLCLFGFLGAKPCWSMQNHLEITKGFTSKSETREIWWAVGSRTCPWAPKAPSEGETLQKNILFIQSTKILLSKIMPSSPCLKYQSANQKKKASKGMNVMLFHDWVRIVWYGWPDYLSYFSVKIVLTSPMSGPTLDSMN